MKQLLSALLLAFCLCTILGSCKKHDDDSNVEVIELSMKTNETYTLRLNASFEEEAGSMITQQALHFSRSELNALPGETWIYTYIPEVNYVGSDVVVIGTFKDLRGWNEQQGWTYQKIVFTIVN